MARHVAKAFGPGETLIVDGQDYFDCEFKETTLVYEGGTLPTFSGCHFDNTHWHMEGAAARTINYLQFLYTSGNKTLIEDIFRVIRGAP